MNRPLRAVAYIRVSTEREDMISPELQETAIRDHCKRNGYEVAEVLTDLDLSGRFWKRRQVERAVAMIESKDAEIVVVWKMSRVARNRLDWNIALDRVESAGGRLESATEPIDTTTSSGRFSRGILAELAAFESERAGEQWQETHRRRWSRGLPHNGKPRFGYTYDRENGYTIDPDAAPIVRSMYQRYLAGQGAVSISNWLNTLGIESAPKTARGTMSFLRNGFAAGYMTHHDPRCVGPHTANSKCPRQITERGAQEPIIDQDTYDMFKIESTARETLPPRLVSPVSTMSGIVVCGSCRKRMPRDRNAKHGPIFRCQYYSCTYRTSVAEHRVESAVLEWLPTVADTVSRYAQQLLASAPATRAERERLERAAARAETALNKLTLDYARGMIPDGAYTAARTALEAERDTAALMAANMRTIAAETVARGTVAADLLGVWDILAPAARNRILRNLCIVRVIRTPGSKPLIEVVGLWETGS